MDIHDRHYDMNIVLQTCYNESNVTQRELIEFEMTNDLEHIPDSRELKLYITCYLEMVELLDKKSNKFLWGKFGAYLAELDKEFAERYLKMGKGCPKLIRDIKDHVEFAYQFQVCSKRNNNEVSGYEKFNGFIFPN